MFQELTTKRAHWKWQDSSFFRGASSVKLTANRLGAFTHALPGRARERTRENEFVFDPLFHRQSQILKNEEMSFMEDITRPHDRFFKERMTRSRGAYF